MNNVSYMRLQPDTGSYYVREVPGATRGTCTFQVWERTIGGSVFFADCRLSERAAEKVVQILNGEDQ